MNSLAVNQREARGLNFGAIAAAMAAREDGSVQEIGLYLQESRSSTSLPPRIRTFKYK
jgi:hypothetical protein